ncbi:MAG: hypothetical protein A2521_03320 [Deltaproteobacteria bacterium RIFOXYD12_FULL_57_12]|nr:MAG: hypothetical protein A2521_03320 [Deltaproteobacteria bacterium RIFOXYD12_FULL_57_12]
MEISKFKGQEKQKEGAKKAYGMNRKPLIFLARLARFELGRAMRIGNAGRTSDYKLFLLPWRIRSTR